MPFLPSGILALRSFTRSPLVASAVKTLSIAALPRNPKINALLAALIPVVAATLFAGAPECTGQTEALAMPTTYTFTTFQPYGADSFGSWAIDNLGDVVGPINATPSFGYERLANGTFEPIIDASAIDKSTLAFGISSAGSTIVGEYCIVGFLSIRHGKCTNVAGFLLTEGGFTEILFQGIQNTGVYAINGVGTYVGSYINPTTGLSTGFVSNGTTISYKGAATTLTAVNSKGNIIGSTSSKSFKANESGEILTTFKFPGTTTDTIAWGINDSGTVVGHFTDSGKATHGFIYQKGAYTQFDAPGATATYSYGINDSGSITGTYTDSSGQLWGFIATP